MREFFLFINIGESDETKKQILCRNSLLNIHCMLVRLKRCGYAINKLFYDNKSTRTVQKLQQKRQEYFTETSSKI